MNEFTFVNVVPPLVVGYAMRAECFGDVLYTSCRNGSVVCPFCGGPAEVFRNESWHLHCHACHQFLPVKDMQQEEGWIGVRTFDLLASGEEQFFFPRQWNKGGPWITRNQLGEMLNTYQKEAACIR